MAIQDRLAMRNSSTRPEDHIVLRIAINIGEVRVDGGAAQKRFGIFDSCEAGAAKAALRKLEKPGAK